MRSYSQLTELSPQRLKTFLQCPRRHYLRYIVHTDEPYVPSPYLTIGGALHDTLSHAFRYRRSYRQDPDHGLLSQWTTKALEKRRTVDPSVRPSPSEVIGQALWALNQVPIEARVLRVEEELRYQPRAPYQLQARLDLLVQHPDGEVEAIDHKTGKPRPSDWVAETIHHVVVAGNRRDLKVGDAPIRTTFLHTSQREAISAVMDRDAHRARWEEITGLAERACSPAENEPTPGPPCTWCGYAETYCDAWRESPYRSLPNLGTASDDASAAE